MSVINFRKMLESLKAADLDEGKMNQLSLEIEEWVGDAYDHYGHQVGGEERALMAYRKKFPAGFENEFHKKWNEAEMGGAPNGYEAEELDELEKKKLFNNYSLSLSREEVSDIRKAAMTGRFKHDIVKMEDDGDRVHITFRTGKPKELVKALESFVDFGATSAAEVLGIEMPPMYEEEEIDEVFSNARPGENYTDEQHNTDQEMAMEYAKDEGMDWLKGKEGQDYLMNWVEAVDTDEKEGALEDLISSLQHTMVMGAYNTMGIDIEISTIQAEKFLGEWMKANGLTQITQESLEAIWENPKKHDFNKAEDPNTTKYIRRQECPYRR